MLGDAARGAGPAEGDRRAGHAVRRPARRCRSRAAPASSRRCRGLVGQGGARGARRIRRRRGSRSATPVGPKLWLWVLHPAHGGAPASDACRCCSAVVAVRAGRGGVPAPRAAGAAQAAAAPAPATGGSGVQVFGSPRHRANAVRTSASAAARSRTSAERDRPPADRDRQERRPRPVSSARRPGAPASRAAPRSWPTSIPSARGSTPARAPSAATACSNGWARAGWRSSTRRSCTAPRASARVYVVKRLRPEVARNRAAVEQFIDEAKLRLDAGALEHRARVRLRQGRRRVLPGAGVHHRARPREGAAAPHRDDRASAERAAGALHRPRGAGGARLRAQPDRRRRATRSASSTATSRRATSWSPRAAR